MLGEEALPQIAVGEVQLDPLEAGVAGTARSVDEILFDPGNVVQGHFARDFRQVRTKGDGRRGDSVPATGIVGSDVVIAFPRAVGAGLAPGVGNLDTRHRACRLDRLHHRHERLGVGVAPDPGATGGDAPFRCHGGGLHYQQACTATGEAGQVHVVPVVDHAVLSHVLAHRRDGDAVAQSDIFQGVGLEQGRHGQTPGRLNTIVRS